MAQPHISVVGRPRGGKRQGTYRVAIQYEPGAGSEPFGSVQAASRKDAQKKGRALARQQGLLTRAAPKKKKKPAKRKKKAVRKKKSVKSSAESLMSKLLKRKYGR